jgi:hypothetical protein
MNDLHFESCREPGQSAPASSWTKHSELWKNCAESQLFDYEVAHAEKLPVVATASIKATYI